MPGEEEIGKKKVSRSPGTTTKVLKGEQGGERMCLVDQEEKSGKNSKGYQKKMDLEGQEEREME